MIDSMFQEGTDAALNDQVTRPTPTPPPAPGFSMTGLLGAPFRGIGAGVSKGIAFGAEIAGAFGQVAGAYDIGPNATPEQQRQAEAARQKLLKPGGGIDYSNEAGDLFRQRAADIMPDPKTAHTSEQVVAGLADVATRAVGYSLTLGPLAPLAFGGDTGLEEADRLKQQGVDVATRTKAGAVAGVMNAAAVALPMTGATALIRFGKGAAAGVGTVVGQSAAERAIVRAAGYDKVADTFDPLDPVALALGVVPGVLGAALGHAAPKAAAERPRALHEMGLGERQALRFDDVRLDAYAVQAAQREGIPPEILLAVKNAGEKSGSTATSPKGAQGVMQFMPSTFREFGRGDPTDPMNSIDAGAKYLKSLHDTYGDWDAAIAHYNGGGRQAAKVRSGQVPVPETAAYLQRVHDYLGKTGEEHIAAAARNEPDLVPAARVGQVTQALDATRLTPDADLVGRDAHLSAVETAADQLARGDAVDVHLPAERLVFEPAMLEDSYGKPLEGLRTTFDNGQGGQGVMELGIRDGRMFPAWVDAGLAGMDSQSTGGRVRALYERAIAEAERRGLAFTSDDSVTVGAQRVYDSLARRGYEVQRNPAARDALPPEVITPRAMTSDGSPVYTVRRVRSPEQTATAAEQLRAARPQGQPAEGMPPRAQVAAAEAEQAARKPSADAGSAPRNKPQPAASDVTGKEDMAPASVARAAAEASMLDPEMLVHLDGMDAPMRVGDLLEKVRAEARQDTLTGKLVEVAAACDLSA